MDRVAQRHNQGKDLKTQAQRRVAVEIEVQGQTAPVEEQPIVDAPCCQ